MKKEKTSLWLLFWTFAKMGVMTFGGGYAMLPILQREVIDNRGWATEEELMERFVRGDKSRHTEGSGLGLSIARNLVELQGGSFRIHIDGDLFKVVIEFPLYHGMPYAVTIPEK